METQNNKNNQNSNQKNNKNIKEENVNKDSKEITTLSYEQEKIALIFNILNQVQFVGIQQAQAIAQISVILNNPIKNDNNQ